MSTRNVTRSDRGATSPDVSIEKFLGAVVALLHWRTFKAHVSLNNGTMVRVPIQSSYESMNGPALHE